MVPQPKFSYSIPLISLFLDISCCLHPLRSDNLRLDMVQTHVNG